MTSRSTNVRIQVAVLLSSVLLLQTCNNTPSPTDAGVGPSGGGAAAGNASSGGSAGGGSAGVAGGGPLPDGGPDGGIDGGDAVTGFCRDSAAAVCDVLLRCQQVTGQASCEATIETFRPFFRTCLSAERAAIDAGRAAFDATTAAACLAAIRRDTPCDSDDPVGGRRACDGVVRGKTPTNGTCSSHAECAPGNFCDAAGSCQPRRGAGMAADAGVQCQQGLYVFQQQCAAPVPANGDCSMDQGQRPRCVEGTQCGGSFDRCILTTGSYQGLGNSCGQGGFCRLDLTCRTPPSSFNGSCEPYSGVSGTCTSDFNCRWPLRCMGASASARGTCQ